jgi:hypothetical protein
MPSMLLHAGTPQFIIRGRVKASQTAVPLKQATTEAIGILREARYNIEES